jgi:adenine deaminase
MLSPYEFLKNVILHGTTTVIADPHEIANVLGIKGMNIILNEAKKIPISLYLTIPSCVPSTNLETNGGRISLKEIRTLLKNPSVIGMGEMMNYEGVIKKESIVLKKMSRVRGRVIDGHAPKLSGKKLSAYIASGIFSDHECTSGEEALEKLRKGMWIMIREGSAAKNLEKILSYFLDNKIDLRKCMFVSDDIHCGTLLTEGHLDRILRKAVKLGLDPIEALRGVTLNPAEYFRLNDRGSISVGKRADIVVVGSIKNFRVDMVISDGKIVVRNGKLVLNIQEKYSRKFANSVKLKKKMRAEDFSIKTRAKDVRVRVIGVRDGSILTKKIILKIKTKNGEITSDVEKDILKVSVIERHKKTGKYSIGLVKGFGLKEGAIGSTVAHDSHNIVVVGTNDKDIATVANTLQKVGGGVCIVKDEKVVDILPLEIAGLMSKKNAKFVSRKLENLHTIARNMGCKLSSPFITLSFLSLPVIPELKITDKGLVENFKIVNLIFK